MDLRAEIDRGEVVLARPKLDKDGHKKWHPRSATADLTLYARVDKGEVALGRWPTTIGGWKTIEKSDGSMALKYKESVTATPSGPRFWPRRPGTRRRAYHPQAAHQAGDTWERRPRSSARLRAAYGWWRWCTIRSRC